MTRLLARVPDSIRDRLDDWRFWNGVAFFGLGLTIVGLYFVNAHTQQEESTRKATARATAAATYQQCVGSIPALTKINTFLEGERDLADVLVRNSVANVATTDPSDPQFATRRDNLARLVRARAKVAAVPELPIPTIAKCEARGAEP